MSTKIDQFPKWDLSKPSESIQLLYTWALERSLERIKWYEVKSRKKKKGSQTLRAVAIVLASLGTLCPLLNATDLFSRNSIVIAQWGYVALAAAAAVLGYDKFFGLSSGWIRYISTQMTLERMMAEFQYDWIILQAKQNTLPATEVSLLFIQKLRDYTVQVESLVKQETDAWASEFQSSLAELQKIVSTEVEKRKPGAIKVVVTNVREFEVVSIFLDGTPMKELAGVSEGIIESVPSGYHEVMASARKKDGRKSNDTKVVQVSSNSLASVEFTLHVPG